MNDDYGPVKFPDYGEPDEDYYDEPDDYYDEPDEDEEDIALSHGDFINGATYSFPFQLEIPSDLNALLSVDKTGSSSDADGSYKTKMWSKVWPNVKPDLIDPAQAAADYYLLFALTNNSFVQFEPMEYPSSDDIQLAGEILEADQKVIDQQKLLAEDKKVNDPRFILTELGGLADAKYRQMVYQLDSCFREYVHLACGGELRHHQSCNESLGAYRRGAWVKWFYIYEQNGPEALLQMADLFEEFSGSSYGGPPWANAARILYQRETGTLGPDEFTTMELFIDRVFTLEHNGGCFLNKLDWVNLRKGREAIHSRHFAEMKDTVLNAHASNPTNIDMLLGYASQEVIDLTLQYLKVANDFNIDIIGTWHGKKSVTFTMTEPVAPKSNIEKDSSGGVIDWSETENLVSSGTVDQDDILHSLELALEKADSFVGNKIDAELMGDTIDLPLYSPQVPPLSTLSWGKMANYYGETIEEGESE
jgi:hypothetical protein